MATRIYGISKGDHEKDVTEGVGSATASKNIELTVDFAAITDKKDVLIALDQIRNHIVTLKWPPA